MRVLVIDDDDALREVIAGALESQGYEVLQANNGRNGVDSLHRSPADLVITDIIMPEQEGVGTILEIRKSFPDLKIIAMSGGTGSGSVDYLEVAEKLGAADTLMKPFRQHQLLSAVRGALGQVETA
ncbi:MAG: response regulator [Alphaproteobacteria bacterium]|jgi:DNA-binding NtrC family response regulator|nr:response regulator [Alphaproteobacteria bacterium]MBT4711543.1 response regulator [Alphaproteobacteria bacterium]